MRKVILLIVASCIFLTLDAQYKRFVVSAFATTHNFNSGKFYSSPGIQATFRLNRFFSLESGISRETIKHHEKEFDDIHGGYFYINNTLKYYQMPITFNTSFGNKLLVEFGVGVTFSFDHYGYDDGFKQEIWMGDSTKNYFEYEYNPYVNGLPIMLHLNTNITYPITKNLVVGVRAKRSVLKDFVQDDSHNFRYFNYYNAFRLIQYSLYIGYQFNFSKKTNFEYQSIHLLKKK